MNITKTIEWKKDIIIPRLYEWAETFNVVNIMYNKNTLEDDEETAMTNSYKYVLNLAKRLENNNCSKKDYTDIYFHIEQINYNEIRIRL